MNAINMDAIIAALKAIKEPGSFCTKREMMLEDLHLEVKSYGELKFPLKTRDAKALIKLARPAQFGWRDQTLLDKKVRNAWEISESQLTINNVAWDKKLNAMLQLLKSDLGLAQNAELNASLHNLLIYEPGQFFDYHQDSEKLNGMIATLVIVLPSPHQGGELFIDSHGIKKQFQSSRFPLDKLTLIAFYADCHHAVKKITQGYRLALTYNLTLKNSTQKSNAASSEKPSYKNVIETLRDYFSDETVSSNEWFHPSSPKQYVYLLDHSYTQQGLSWQYLKNVDRLRADALRVAADALDLEIHMALADVQETWDCEAEYDPYDYHRYDDEDDDYENDIDDIVLTELLDSDTTLRYWIDRDNKSLNYKEYSVPSPYIGWTKASHEFEPFESEYEGFMGNYGNTMDRWYHRAAIILWQKKDHYAVLFRIDAEHVIHELFELTQKKPSQEIHMRHIIYSLLPYWSHYLQAQSESTLPPRVLSLCLYVQEPQLAKAMLTGFTLAALSPETTTLFLSLQLAYGTSWCIEVLKEWGKTKDRWGHVSKCKNISVIIKNLSQSQNDLTKITDWLLTYQLQKIKEMHESVLKTCNRATLIEGISQRMEDVMDLIAACVTVNQQAIYATFLKHVMTQPALYPPIELVNILYFFEDTVKRDDLQYWQYQTLFDYVFNALKKEKEQGIRKSDDWSIKEKLPCHCHDCETLSKFLQSETIQQLKWPLNKERRRHIHQIMDGLGIPVTHQTEHTGSPHKLVLAKTQKLHIQAKQHFDKIEQAFLCLQRLCIKNK